MLRTWRAKERRGGGAKIRRKREEKEEPSVGQREKFRSAYTRAAEKCKARLPWRYVKLEKLEFVYICELPLRICRGTTLAGYSVNSEQQRAAAPVPRPFFSP